MKKIFKATAFKISILQNLFLLIGVTSFFYFSIDAIDLSLSILGYFLYGGIGFSMMLHRHYSHCSFKLKSIWLKYIFDFIAVTSNRGSIVGWVYTHRSHHINADTDKDPHSPLYKGWKIFFPHIMNYNKKFNKFIVKDLLTPYHKFIDEYYILILMINSLIMMMIGIEFWIFFYIVPLCILHIMLLCFIYFGHDRYLENSEVTVKDNNFFGYFLYGEGWHFSHHKNPKDWNFGNHKRIEIISLLIKILKK